MGIWNINLCYHIWNIIYTCIWFMEKEIHIVYMMVGVRVGVGHGRLLLLLLLSEELEKLCQPYFSYKISFSVKIRTCTSYKLGKNLLSPQLFVCILLVWCKIYELQELHQELLPRAKSTVISNMGCHLVTSLKCWYII